MKPVIMYYSHSGNNQKLAQELQDRLGCEMYEIKEKKKRKNISIFVDFLIKRKSRLAPLDVEVKSYSPVLLLAPVWAGKVAAPMRTFIQREKPVNYSFITLCSGAEGQKDKITAELSVLTPGKPKAVAELWINSLLPEEQQNKIKYVTNFRFEKEYMKHFNKEIQEFLDRAFEEEKPVP